MLLKHYVMTKECETCVAQNVKVISVLRTGQTTRRLSPSCGILLKLDTDEGSYAGAAQKSLLVLDDE